MGTKTVNGDGRAFVHPHGRVYDLNTLLDPTSDPDWDIRVAYDINDAGVIVGWGILHSSYQPVVMTHYAEQVFTQRDWQVLRCSLSRPILVTRA